MQAEHPVPQAGSGRHHHRDTRRRTRTFTALAAGAVAAGTLACGAITAMAMNQVTATPVHAGATAQAAPPPLTVLKTSADIGNGDIFAADFGPPTKYGAGPEILSTKGKVIWYHAVPAGVSVTDFRTQTYLGKPVLTWWQGTGFSQSPSGTGYIYNDSYKQIAEVKAGDGHEFLITPWNTALITVVKTATVNLTSIGGPKDQTVIDGIVQEIDIRTGKVLYQWNSADHVPFSDSHIPLPATASEAWDWFHINAVHLDTSGNLLISSRYTWAVYDVNRHTGKTVWELGGKHSSFTEKAAPGQVLDRAGEIFAWQHDPEAVSGDLYTVFDDESDGDSTLLPYSRAVTIRLDFKTHVATLVKSGNQPEGRFTPAFGNAQNTDGGDQFVSWGETSSLSEFSRSGTLLFNAKFPPGVFTYRAYLLAWHSAA